MKRPEGFDPATRRIATPPPAGKDAAQKAASRKPVSDKAAPKKEAPASSKPGAAPRISRMRQPVAVQAPAAREKKPRVIRADREARMELRRAARERRRYERGEVRRFTKRARNRRIGWITAGGAFAVLAAMLLVAVYSPILSLKQISVEGTSRVDPAAVQAAVADQIGKPLALVDFDAITAELGEFPLIRSYVTETLPPDALVIRIEEREPVAVRERGSNWELIDPAGIVIDAVPEIPEGMPILRAGDDPESASFRSSVEVLLSLSDKMLARVKSVTATTADDVSLELNSGQNVIWGNADRSELKTITLTAIMKKQKQIDKTDVDYNLSSPTTPLVIEK